MKIILTIVIILISTNSYANFRNTSLNMSVDQVDQSTPTENLKSVSVNKYKHKINYQSYILNISNTEVLINYRFIDDQLQSLDFVLNHAQSHNTYIKYIRALTKKFGKPDSLISNTKLNRYLTVWKDSSTNTIINLLYAYKSIVIQVVYY